MADSEKTASILENLGYTPAKDEKGLLTAKNPVIIFNTCSVRQKAEDRVFGLNRKLEELKNKNLKLKIILTGCMSHYGEEELRKRLPYFDYFVDMKNIEKLPKMLNIKNFTIRQRSHLSGKVLNSNIDNRGEELLFQKVSKISALVPISNGCDKFCTYCIVPFARGREISRPVEEILTDVKKAVANGAKEIWLLGQTVNSYCDKISSQAEFLKSLNPKLADSLGRPRLGFKNSLASDINIKFSGLLCLINALSGDFWIRFTSPHPKDFSDDLIKAMAECRKFAHYINLPVQSGNNTVLKRMGRPYTVDHYKKLVKKIRRAIPDIAISTDVIVGFPGETRKQFEDTKKIFEEIKFDMAFISEYSPRPKTAAVKMFKDDVPHKEKEARKKELNEILKKTALENNKKLVGKTVKVLNGRTEGNKPIKISDKDTKDNFIEVKIIKAKPWKLEGKLL